MIIPQELLTKWKTLRSPGDAEKMAEKSEYSDEAFNRALREGKCSDEVFNTMADFYKEKEEKVNQYL